MFAVTAWKATLSEQSKQRLRERQVLILPGGRSAEVARQRERERISRSPIVSATNSPPWALPSRTARMPTENPYHLGDRAMTHPDTPFPKHWRYYIFIKWALIVAAVVLALRLFGVF